MDATSRNSLYKIHVSLGKIVNALAEKDKDISGEKVRAAGRKSSIAPSVLDDEVEEPEEDKTVIEKIPEEEDTEEDTIQAIENQVKREERSEERDELVEELLSDVEMSGM